MISVNTTYNNIVSGGGHYEWQIINGGNTFDKTNLMNGTITSTLFEQFSIGNVISSQLSVELWDASGISTSDPLVVQFRATNGSSNSSWYTKGTFYIDTLETSPYSEVTKIVAYDAMLKTEVVFLKDSIWQATSAYDIVTAICTEIGVSLESGTSTYISANPLTLTPMPNIGENGTTDREMLSYIGAMYCGNWIINSANKLQLIRVTVAPSNTANVGDAVVTLDASPSETITKVRVNLDGTTFYAFPNLPLQTHTPADIETHTPEAIQIRAQQFIKGWNEISGSGLVVDIPIYATEAIAQSIYNTVKNTVVYPYTAQTAYVDPKYEAGDGITIKNLTSVISNQTITLDALASSDLSFRGEEIINSYYPYITTFERNTLYQFEQMQNEIDSAQTVMGNASYREQTIYISQASGTLTVAPNYTWITFDNAAQETWTTTRPAYNAGFPVLFVATQRQTVEQYEAGNGACDCTTPVVDQTTTVIDGGHITTGTIDAGVVNVTNINASNINTGTLNAIDITGSTITGSTLTSATANGSVRIANGSVDFFNDNDTSVTPFSQIKRVYDSGQGDSVEWTNSGYTKLVNTGGGQWTGAFLQFALYNSGSPVLMQLIYPDSDGTHTKFNTDMVDVNGQLIATKTGYKGSSAIKVAHGTANQGASVFVNRTDTDRSISLAIDPNGVNRGLYVADANMDNWLLYYNDSNLTATKPLNVNGAVSGTNVYSRQVTIGSGGTATITFEADVFNALMSVGGWNGGGFGYLSFLSGYVSASRLSNTVIKSGNNVAVDLSSTSNVFTVKNNSSVNFTLTFLVLAGNITGITVA